MCDLTGDWFLVAHCPRQKNDSAACQARKRVATHFDIERMVDSYHSVWQRVYNRARLSWQANRRQNDRGDQTQYGRLAL